MLVIPNLKNIRLSAEWKAVGQRSAVRLQFESDDGKEYDYLMYFTPSVTKLFTLTISYHLEERVQGIHWRGDLVCSPSNGGTFKHTTRSGRNFVEELRQKYNK